MPKRGSGGSCGDMVAVGGGASVLILTNFPTLALFQQNDEAIIHQRCACKIDNQLSFCSFNQSPI